MSGLAARPLLTVELVERLHLLVARIDQTVIEASKVIKRILVNNDKFEKSLIMLFLKGLCLLNAD